MIDIGIVIMDEMVHFLEGDAREYEDGFQIVHHMKEKMV